jgi:ferredoxin
VECFHEGPNFLVINPGECIDCGLCEPACPVDAIYPFEELPAAQLDFAALNSELAGHWPVITAKGNPPADADEWKERQGKIKYLMR